MPHISAHQCHISVPIRAAFQCQSVPISATNQCSLSGPISATYQFQLVPHISASQ
ncbi:unnamed protein product, partial [Staurois parvus]